MIVQRIRLDLGTNQSQAGIYIHKSDACTQQLAIYLTHDGVPYEYGDGTTASIYFVKPGGGTSTQSAVITDGVIYYTLPSSLTGTAGDLRCEVIVSGPGSNVLRSPEFVIHIVDTL